MKIFLLSLFVLPCLWSGALWAEENILPTPFTEEERLRGFVHHQRDAKEFEAYRKSGLGDVKAARKAWAEMMAKTLPDYRRVKAQIAAPLDERSPEYKQDQKERREDELRLERARRRYVQERDAARKRKQSVKLSEEEEYDLLKKFERIDPSLRALYTGKSKFAKSGGSTSSAPPPMSGGYEPPPPPPPPPGDFFEPDIPPPPPPPPMEPGTFDDAIPPPIFDEPEF